MEANKFHQIIKSGLYGVCIADAVGVPVEFKSREILERYPVVDMMGNGTYNQPIGTWSDDSSMTLALADSMGRKMGVHTHDIMDRFLWWYREGLYTPWGECFDIGHTTLQALLRYETGVTPVLCGGNKINSNGNGSLMRILPMAFVLYQKYGADLTMWTKAMELIHKISALTHRHSIAQSACGIYINIATRLLDGMPLETAVYDGVAQSLLWYQCHDPFSEYTDRWQRIRDLDKFRDLPEITIMSGGYVVETLEATLWCLLNTDNYRDCVLKAINFGHDTDTTAAVVGGLAGLAYGFDGIPQGWIENLAGKRIIEKCCESLAAYVETIERQQPDK